MTKRSGRLRILFIDHTARLGGGEIALIDLIDALDPAIIEPIVLLFEEGPLTEKIGPKIQLVVLPLESSVAQAARASLGWRSVFRFRQVFILVRHILRVSRLIRQLRVDIVHTNSLKSDIIGGISGRLAGRPVIWHVRDRIAPDYLPLNVTRLFRALSRVLPNFLIAISDATLRTLVPASKIATADLSRAATVYDGLRPALLERKFEDVSTYGGDDPSSPRIGLFGRICPWKGQHIFLRAAALLHPVYPSARFYIVGAPLFGEFEYEQQLRKLCNTLGLDSCVEFSGFVDDVAARMETMTTVVHASVIAEPFGLVIVEGMARSKPVVATDGGGVPEIVIDGDTGILVPMDDAAAMAEAIASLLRQPELASKMGKQGRRRVESHFTMTKTARKVEAIYARLLS